MTVLTIVDEPLVHKMLSINLQQMGLLVAWENSIDKACSALQTVVPELIIFDAATAPGYQSVLADRLYGLAERNGIPVITLLGNQGSPVFSQRKDTLNKPIASRQLVDLVRSKLHQDNYLHENLTLRASGITLNPLTHRATHNHQEIGLRRREFDLLAFFMKRPGRVFSREHLLEGIWGEDALVDERSIDVSIRRLRVALEPHGLSNRVETIRGVGYRFCIHQPFGNNERYLAKPQSKRGAVMHCGSVFRQFVT